MLDQLQQKLRSFQADVGWVAIHSIHLTLKFLGEADPSILPQLTDALATAVHSRQAVALRLRGLGFFPNAKNPRVVWCGMEGDLEPLALLQQQVEQVCTAAGFAPENRTFTPHLTLGRIRSKRNLQPLLDYIKMGTDLTAEFRADHMHMYQSVLKPQGAVYTVLKTVAFGSPES